jgi:HPt (histidine-containing phosphotransfer) domain-containing protein
MAQLAITDLEPAVSAAAIDRGQLSRMTFGDRSLEREVLQLFDRQAALLLARMQSRDAAAMAALAHTLKGSAASIGATDVMIAASAVEHAGAGEREAALDRLAAAVDEACAAIAGLLRES